jgi:cytosine/adenosine deaminase-related metal-dependent hydrolase
MPARRLAARWVIPIEEHPIEQGAVLIGGDGRIVALGPDDRVPRPADVPAEEYGDAVLLPGLINTHTHLELTGLEGEVTEPDFPPWIMRVRERKVARTNEQFLAAAHTGLATCWAAGVTTVADTGDSGAVIQALARAGGSGIAYQEVFGGHPDHAGASLAGLQARVETLAAFAVGRVRIGVSPHAPYTVSGPLYAATAAWARAESLPLAAHVAESRAECDLLARGIGGFAEAWCRRGIPLPVPLGRTPIEWLDDHRVLGENTLCIHGIQVTPGDLERMRRAGAALAHCPLSNRAHGHGVAPLREYLAHGIRVGLGTDSVMSVGRLNLLAEARAAREAAGLDPHQALALCTLEAARALGLQHEIGSLRPGKWADCTLILPPSDVTERSLLEQVLATGPEDVVATYLSGGAVYRAHARVWKFNGMRQSCG